MIWLKDLVVVDVVCILNKNMDIQYYAITAGPNGLKQNALIIPEQRKRRWHERIMVRSIYISINEDELIYPSDEALDEYAQQWEELQRKELCYGNNKNGS